MHGARHAPAHTPLLNAFWRKMLLQQFKSTTAHIQGTRIKTFLLLRSQAREVSTFLLKRNNRACSVAVTFRPFRQAV
jgi:hypothetical protein